MCGLVAVFGSLNELQLRKFRDLLTVGALRGEEATGIASINQAGHVHILKRAMNPYYFFADTAKDIYKVCNTGARAIIGHNRWPTQGENTNANAHPFYHNRF